MTGYRSRELTANGKRSIVFNPSKGLIDLQVTVPCGQCIGCRLERSRQWAMRCMHEASLYADNCFITLTYNSNHLPSDHSLHKREFQLFMKRLRKKYPDKKLRYYHCGEYGKATQKNGWIARPHYHACLFNFDFPDKELYRITKTGEKLYTSEILAKTWRKGFCTVGSVTFDSAAYVARYITKKMNGEKADAHYWSLNKDTGELHSDTYTVDDKTGEITSLIKSEYNTMSNGIGKGWFEQFSSDVYPSDEVIIKQKKMKPPKYYDHLYEIEDPDGASKVKAARAKNARSYLDNNTPDRLLIREEVQKKRFKRLIRPIEEDI